MSGMFYSRAFVGAWGAMFGLSLGCAGTIDPAEQQQGPSVSSPPDGYRVFTELAAGGRVVCTTFSDCGAVNSQSEWRQGPGCRRLGADLPPKLYCDESTYYVLPDGSARQLPERFLPPSQSSGDSNRLMVQDKAVAIMGSDAGYDYGYVLLDERLEVIVEFGRTILRAHAFKDGAYGVSLDGGRTGRVLRDGTLVVD